MKISVCMATYNGGLYIRKQLSSILCQLEEEDEVIISDDGSTDDTLDVINSFNDVRIHLFRHEHDFIPDFEGASYYYVTQNFANALQHAHGDIIFLSDQDDIWAEGKVERCLDALRTNICIVHNYSRINLEERMIKKISFPQSPLHKSVLMNIVDSHFRGCCMAFRRELLRYILPIPMNVIGHDYWIGALACHYGDITYICEPLTLARWYPESVSATKKTSLKYKITYRTVLLKEVIKRIWQSN